LYGGYTSLGDKYRVSLWLYHYWMFHIRLNGGVENLLGFQGGVKDLLGFSVFLLFLFNSLIFTFSSAATKNLSTKFL
jgi:hypothetical protein